MGLESIIGPAVGAVVGGIGGQKGKEAQAAPTSFESLPKELQNFSKEQIFPRLEDLFNRPAEVSPKAQAISPTADPLFASPELFRLQQFANANDGRTTIQPKTVAPTVEAPSDGISLAEEFLKGLQAPVQGSARGQFLGGGQFSGDLASQLASFGDLGTLSQALSDQGFTRATPVNAQSLKGMDLGALIRAAQGVI